MSTDDKPTTTAASASRRDGDVLDHNLHDLLGQAGDPATIAPAARDRIRRVLVARAAAPARAGSRVVLVGWGLALSAAAAVAVATFTGGGGGGAGGASGGSASIAAPDAPRSKTSLTLADGSTAELGDGGSLKELGSRRVRISGKVFLDVVPGQGQFTVETSHGQLAVLGTRFVVDAGTDVTTAAVLRGAVAMRSSGGEEVIRAGEEGTMSARSAPVRKPAPRLSHLVSWVAERRRRDEKPPALPARSGVLVARNPTSQEQEFPLPLRALTIDVHLENQVARVAMDQTFFNPQPQQLEGVYKFALPPDAAVARLAMYVDGRLTESAVVERMRARQIYEDIVYTRRDPALLEQMGASKVSLRIFPLPPKQDKRVILAYTQPLARTYDDVTLTVPLPDLEAPVGDVDLRVKVVGCGGCELASPSHAITVLRTGGDAVVGYQAKSEKLGDSLILRIRQPSAPAATVATTIANAKRYVLLRARPDAGTAVAPADRPHRWVILDDTSASRGAVERRAQAALVDQLVQEIDERDQVIVIAFDATHRRFGPWQDAMAIDRRALATFLATDAGLGETDLVGALAGAKRLLDGDAGYVVYVGDGTATGAERTIDSLRDALAGSKATFIGLGVGDGVDLPTLDALADATGGLATHIDLGDDLAWRALDVVASLYTPRLTGLEASVVADGDPADAPLVSAYLRSRQVAAGEDLEVVVQAPARTDVLAVTLRGQLAGQPWQRTFTVADTARAAGDAGYLPRLWAERRLDALVTAGDRALAPCTTTPCASDEERAVLAYHTRKGEMVALGKEHFLLSQHTSLLVLENDAMYRQYGVTKGSGATWAPYSAPDTIAVVAQAAAPISDEGELWRSPTSTMGDQMNELVVSAMLKNGNKEFESAGYGVGAGTIGLGRNGTIGHASGSGPTVPVTATAAASGVGDGGGGTGRAAGGPMPVGGAPKASAEPNMADDLDNADFNDVLEAKKDSDRPMSGADSTALSLDEIAQPTDGRFDYHVSPPAEEAESAGFLGAKLRISSRRENIAANIDGGLLGGESLWWSDRGGVGMPLAYYGSADWRLDDLTAWLPGLARTTYDDLAAELDAAGGAGTGSITDDARRALTEARARLRPGRWRWGSDADVVVDGAGRVQRSRTLETGVREVMTYDGATLTTSYPDLGLAATRAVGAHEPALYGTLVPLMAPRPEHLARWYQVTLSGTRTIRLTPAAGGKAYTELDLGDDGTIAAVRQVIDGQAVTVMAVTRAGSGFEVVSGGRTVSVGYQVDDAVSVASSAAAAVTVELPLRADGHWQKQLAGATSSTPGWRALQHQRAAAALATGNPSLVAGVARELIAAGGLGDGERALLGSALAWLDTTSRAALAGGGGALADYLAASAALRDGRSKPTFTDVGARADGLIATLAAHRALLQAIERGSYPAARAAFDRVMDRHPSALLGLIAARRLAQTFYYQDPEAISAFDRVAVGRWRNQARVEAAQLAGYVRGYGKTVRPDAGDRWVALLEDVDLSAPPPAVDQNARAMVQASARGEVGWNLAMSAWKQRVLAAGDYGHVMAFVRAAAVTSPADLDPALDRAMTLAGDDAGALNAVVTMAFNAGRTDRARSLLATARARQPKNPVLIRLASQIAEQAGDPAEAARLLVDAMRADADSPVMLSTLRGEYSRLIRLHGASAAAATGPARDQAVEAALAAGRDWRALDPDLASRERQLGELLVAFGKDEEGWRYLSTPIDLAPREGTSFQGAAEALQAQGKLEPALALWRRAFAIDATNPTWLMKAAQVELALGRKDDAQATIARITDRTWHNRFWSVVNWAQQAKASRTR